MEVTALCSQPMLVTLFLLALHDSLSQELDPAFFPMVLPNRQQFFAYESINISCEGIAGLNDWRVLKKVKDDVQPCFGKWSTSLGPCIISNAIPDVDSGEFWCELGSKRSKTINITVTDGSVILDIPVLPVIEGDNLTLSCRDKASSSILAAQFFKDGVLMDMSPTDSLTFISVSKSYEGLYKCSISGSGESAESWLHVRAAFEEDTSSVPQDTQLYLLLFIGVSAFLVILSLLLGLLALRKRNTNTTVRTSPPSIQSSPPPQTVTEDCAGNLQQTTYSVVSKPKKKKKNKGSEETDVAQQTTYACVSKLKKEKKKVSEEKCADVPLQTTYAEVGKTKKKWKNKVSEEDCTDPLDTTYSVINEEPGVSGCSRETVPGQDANPLLKKEYHHYYTIDEDSV